jgi:hypothetical protein
MKSSNALQAHTPEFSPAFNIYYGSKQPWFDPLLVPNDASLFRRRVEYRFSISEKTADGRLSIPQNRLTPVK